MVKVFISYRRSDSSAASDRIYRRLEHEFGRGNVFKDQDSIPIGTNFVRVLEDTLGECDALLVVIGPHWLSATDAAGRRRLDDENDFVRAEIEWGLRRNIHVVPVLVDGAAMPRRDELPPGIAEELPYRHAAVLGDGAAFDRDLERLVRALARIDRGSFDIWRDEEAAGEPSAPAARGDGLLIRLVGLLLPGLHYRLVRWGLAPRPADFEAVHNYLDWFAREMARLNEVKQYDRPTRYVPVAGQEMPPVPGADTDYAARQSRAKVLRVIRRSVRLLAGLSAGGDQATAQLAGLNRASRPVRNVARLLRRRDEPVILLGDPGSGKSMTLREIGRQIAQDGAARVQPPVVVYVRLGQYRSCRGDKPGEVWPLIRQSIPTEAHARLRRLLPRLEEERRLVVLFDGMDEMERPPPASGRPSYGARVAALSEFAQKYQGAVRTLFACRINDFSPRFIHRQLVLLEFDRRQVREYLHDNLGPWPLQVAGESFTPDRMARRLLDNPELRETARNPLTLFLLTLFLMERRAWPATRAALFDHYLRFLFQQTPAAAAAEVFPEALWQAACDDWSRLAFLTTTRYAGTSLELAHLPADWDADRREVVVQTGRRCGLLVIDETDEQAIRFIHHRVQEYLTAYYLDRHEAALPAVDWAALLDTPRWQETLINLASIQQARSPVLHAVLESLREVAAARSLPAETERRLADRVVLASRVVRELGRDPAKLPPRFVESFADGLRRLASVGRPTTQVKMLWAWNNAAGLCPLAVLDVPLQSPIDWVREQALLLVSGRDPTRPASGLDLRRELAVDFANGHLLRRAGAYFRAAQGDRKVYAAVASAVAGQALAAAGFFAAVWLAFRGLLALRPLSPAVAQAFPGVGGAVLATLVAAVNLSAAWLVRGVRGWGFRRWLFYLGAASGGVLAVLSGYGSGAPYVFTGVRLILGAALALGALPLAAQLAFWLPFGLFILPILSPSERSRQGTAWRIALRTSELPGDRRLIAIGFAAAILTVATEWGFRRLAEWGVDRKAVDDNFLGAVCGLPVLLYCLYLLVMALYAGVRAAWSALQWVFDFGRDLRLRITGRKAWPSAAEVGWVVARALWSPVRGLLRLAGSCLGMMLLGPLVVLAVYYVVGAPFWLTRWGLESVGLDEHQRGQLPGLLLLIGLLSTGLLGPMLLLLWASRLAGSRLSAWRRGPGTPGLTAVAWADQVRQAPPEGQAALLRRASPHAFGVEVAEFLRVLEGLEGHITQEPAASRYWRLRHDLEEIVRQERLSNLALGDLAEAPPPPPGSPTPRPIGGEPPPPAPAPHTGRLARTTAKWLPRLRRVARTAARAAGVVGFLVLIAAAVLNRYTEGHRTVYVANGLPEPVVVAIDDGAPFEVGPRSTFRTNVPEGSHHVTFHRRPDIEFRQEFAIRSGYFARLLDNATSAYVVNLGGTAVLRYAAGFEKQDKSYQPVGTRYYVGTLFDKVAGVDHAFEDDVTSGSALQVFPDLPAWCFWRLPTLFTEDERLDAAERALTAHPENGDLLDAYVEACLDAGKAARAREFLARQWQAGSNWVPWHVQRQDLVAKVDGPEALRKEYEALAVQNPDRPGYFYLAGRLQPSLSGQLDYYNRALALHAGHEFALRAKVLALARRGDIPAAIRECRQALEKVDDGLLRSQLIDLYLAAGGDGLAAAARMLDELRARRNDPEAGYRTALALDVLTGHPDQARERLRRLEVRWQAEQREMPYVTLPAEDRAATAVALYQVLGDGDAELAAAETFPDPRDRARARAVALLGLGRTREAVAAFPDVYPEQRGFFLLLAGVLGGGGGQEANEFRESGVHAWRQSMLTEYRRAADWLSRPEPPDPRDVTDLAMSRDDKALLWIALAQRHPTLKPAALAAAEQLARGPFYPWILLRRALAAPR